MFTDRDDMTFTNNLRAALWEVGWRKGKALTFYYRMDNNKRKKVRGNFQYLSHVPDKGFYIRLDHVYWLGNYWGPIGLGFCTKAIEWDDEHFVVAFAGAMDMAKQKMPRLEANTPP